MEATISMLLELVKPGETVIVEYETSYVPELILKLVADYTKENNVPFVIDDYFDSLYTLLAHYDIHDLDVDIGHSYVLKVGGRNEVGGTVKHVKFHPDPRVLLMNYNENFLPSIGTETPAINLVLGFESALYFVRDIRDFYRLLLGLQRYVGNKRRKAFYILHSEFFANLPRYILPELRRIATSLWTVKSYPAGISVLVLKSPDMGLLGRQFNIDIGGVVSGER